MSAVVVRELEELIRLSHGVGADPDWVQGGGGNTSVKSADRNWMWVKASGTSLLEMNERQGFACMDLARTLALLDRGDLAKLPAASREAEVSKALKAAVREPLDARPSVESPLHALLSRVVIHTHPVGLVSWLCNELSRAGPLLEGGDVRLLQLPYIDPGFTLGTELQRRVREFETRHGALPNVVLLENHGVVVSADEVEECLSLHRWVAELGQRFLGVERVNPLTLDAVVTTSGERPVDNFALRGLLREAGMSVGVLRIDDAPIAGRFLQSSAAVERCKEGALTPDQIVYCGRTPLVLSGADRSEWLEAVREYRASHPVEPRVIVIPERCVAYVAADLRQWRVLAEIFRIAMATLCVAAERGRARFLDSRQAQFIEEWEAEKYRAQLHAGKTRNLKGRIVVLEASVPQIESVLEGAGATVLRVSDPPERALEIVEASLGGIDALILPRISTESLERWSSAFSSAWKRQQSIGQVVILTSEEMSLPAWKGVAVSAILGPRPLPAERIEPLACTVFDLLSASAKDVHGRIIPLAEH